MSAYTEAEAKTKRCCAAPGVGSEPLAPGANSYGRRCIASECMAWRWTEDVCRHKSRGTFHSLAAMDEGNSDADQYERLPSRGFCGLAGTLTPE